MIPKFLFILELANNHMGDVAHGSRIISDFGSVCRDFPEFKFGFKLQYRDLDTFVHPSMRDRTDIKYIKRFTETRLSRVDFDTLVKNIRAEGFMAIATPFDNSSIEVIRQQGLDIIKIASCSFNDWPLLEAVAKEGMPVIASTAGAALKDIDKVVSFLQHRGKDFAIMHCVGEYPTPDGNLNINRINILKDRYPGLRIGFSTHENPSNVDVVKMAIAKGVTLFEKHVGVETEKYALNEYSASPAQFRRWLEAARYAITVCGKDDGCVSHSEAELASMRSLRRGVFAKRDIAAGTIVSNEDVFFAFPSDINQVTANEWSKYSVFKATRDIKSGVAIDKSNIYTEDTREKILTIAERVKAIFQESGITIPGGVELEISHHYGLEKFEESGLTMLTIINRAYCKKLLVSLPGQRHPEQYHKLKEETFHVLYGDLVLQLNGQQYNLLPGDVVNIEPLARHSFVSATGAIIEEISSTHHVNDSYYTDESIMKNSNRKTKLTYWMG